MRQTERLETVVVKSDQTVHTMAIRPAPKGTRFEDRVLRLTDGTLVGGVVRDAGVYRGLRLAL